MYKIGRSHYPRDVSDTVVRRGFKFNEGSLNILGGAIQRWVRSICTPVTSAEYTAVDSPQKYNIIGSLSDTSHQYRHSRWTVCQALTLFFKQECDAVASLRREPRARHYSTAGSLAILSSQVWLWSERRENKVRAVEKGTDQESS